MGIPKFFRWISERYPLCSQLITESHIPEFDNLYLDMNGIIHNCAHPNDDDVHFRLSEDKIFIGIFNYIDHLFQKIKPKRVFFMAIDGVAPRAKMNQQRARRFRTAKEAHELREKALKRGESLPDEKPFDSNCITPGTEFMEKLSEHLKYFVNRKVTEDANWQGIRIILSGHEVPGEGEHKIMEFIRLSKAQPDYDPNVRHCLYGLDADLIMLGLLSHEPHFSLLREEVKFGPVKKKKNSLESQNFYLMHLSLLREYLDLEFCSLKENIQFTYDLERVIDDFILLALFVGNDFLPHLPGMHINEGALAFMFVLYKKVLPRAGGYINDGGSIDIRRVEMIFNELRPFENEFFESELVDEWWFRSKRQGHEERNGGGNGRRAGKKKLVLSPRQYQLLQEIKVFVLERTQNSLHFPSNLPAADRAFIVKLAKKLGIRYGTATSPTTSTVKLDEGRLEAEFDTDHVNPLRPPLGSLDMGLNWEARPERYHRQRRMNGESGGSREDGSQNSCHSPLPSPGDQAAVVSLVSGKHLYIEFEVDDDSSDEESLETRSRILRKYDSADVVSISEEDVEKEEQRMYEEKYVQWKKDYYKEKLELDSSDETLVKQVVLSYIEGLCWVLHYYYRGVPSWGWFYPYHYAPKLSDLVDLHEYKVEFELGKPFKPFEQLMGVLPERSKMLIPEAYRELMSNAASPIIDFYPVNFELDLNGKKQDWEAVVKIPFINQDRLLNAMKTKEKGLTRKERRRNTLGHSYLFTYDPSLEVAFESPRPDVFPDISICKCRMDKFFLPTLACGAKLRTGLCEGARLGAKLMAGFPSLRTLRHTGALGSLGVNVFNSESRNESMIVTLFNQWNGMAAEDVAGRLLGNRVYFGYPYLQEGFVQAISDELFRYDLDERFAGLKNGNASRPAIRKIPHDRDTLDFLNRKAGRLEYVSSKKCGCIIGPVDYIVHIRALKGLVRHEDGSLVREYSKLEETQDFAAQTIVLNIQCEDPRMVEKPPIPVKEEYPIRTRIFYLGTRFYGAPAEVIGHAAERDLLHIRLVRDKAHPEEPDVGRRVMLEFLHGQRYLPSFIVAKKLGVSGLVLSKVTSSLHVVINNADKRLNLGLNLKFEAKGQKVLGYSKKSQSGWEFSEKAMNLICEYMERFPEFFQGLQRKAKGDLYKPEDFYEPHEAEQKVHVIRDWLKTVNVRDLERVPLDAEALDKDRIRIIEEEIDKLRESPKEINICVLKNVPRQALLKPAHAPTRLVHQNFALGDRVVFVRDAGNVPIAIKGTVVAIQGDNLDVVFDETFMSGGTLDGRCSPYRGMSVLRTSVLNTSNMQLVKRAVNVTPQVPERNSVGDRDRLRALPMKGPIGPPIQTSEPAVIMRQGANRYQWVVRDQVAPSATRMYYT